MSDVLVCFTGDIEHPERSPEAEAVVVERRGAVTRYVLPDGTWFELDAVEASACASRDLPAMRRAA